MPKIETSTVGKLAIALASLTITTTLANSCTAAPQIKTVSHVEPIEQKLDAAIPANPTIRELIGLLDSRSYSVRKQATQSLIQKGSGAIGDLVDCYFSSGPERRFRIKQILEGIGKTADEDTLLKTTGLLLVLYSSGGQEAERRIGRLRSQWHRIRHQSAMEWFARQNVDVSASAGIYQAPVKLLAVEGRVGGLKIAQSQFHADQPAATEKSPNQILQTTDVSKRKELASQIVTNDADANRKLLFQAINRSQVATKQAISPALSVDDFGRVTRRQGASLAFPENWKPTDEAFERISHLQSPVTLSFKGQRLSDAQWKSIANTVSITSIDLDGVPLPVSSTLALPRSISSLKISGVKLESEFCASLQQFNGMINLSFDNCEFTDDAVDELNELDFIRSIPVQYTNQAVDVAQIQQLARLKKMNTLIFDGAIFNQPSIAAIEGMKQVRSLFLRNMNASEAFLDGIGRLENLQRIDFKGCKLDFDAFRRLEQKKVRIAFVARAFLGIQCSRPNPRLLRPDDLDLDLDGRRDPELATDCMITRVIAGSAADKAGMKVGDVIKTINGDRVKQFQDIRLHIAQCDVDDAIQIEVDRDGKTVKFEVALGDYETSPKF